MSQEGLPNPWDERSARLDMRETLTGENSRAEMDAFFDKKANAALGRVFRAISEIIGDDIDLSRLSATWEGDFPYHETYLGDDLYRARSVGIKVTRKDEDLEVFYYFFYAMSIPNNPSGSFCVFTKTNGRYNICHDINTLTIENLFEDIKKALLEAKPLMNEGY